MRLINHARRHFLRRSAAWGTLSALAAHGLSAAQAQSLNDYKALVCVFLYGGNDGSNMVIPADSAGYAEYAAVRTSASGIQIPQSELLLFQPKNSTRVFGFHPALDRLHPLFAQGKLAVLANVGPLNRPTTKADYQAGRDLPYQLFSHPDQQAQWQSAASRAPTSHGWGGRIADAVAARNAGAAIPSVISFAGASRWGQGQTISPLTLPTSGSLTLNGVSGNDAVSRAPREALAALLDEASEHVLVREAADGLANAINVSALVNPVLNSSPSAVAAAFAGSTGSLATQLQQVAKMIASRSSFGLKRQIFFVSLGGFDTHANQATTHEALLTQLDDALRAFYDATVALGVADQVTTFTLSDFGRTLKPAAGAGTDHGWGNHHLILGGAVKGGVLYGRFPSLALGGPDEVGEGRLLPSTSVDQYAAVLARWFGLDDAALATVLPNLSAFPEPLPAFL
ncbi:MAG: DUF1501 domain-containing protein [Casimicrobiaceae bacterium]|nr:DUF1501 domain-containing protein [Casimicrobiaceae bacterium]